jgi:2-keto-4-pentenoate hydratase/2-oxohepta-3-ene-1,7-dioic acid hydratase in catechol pathway
LIGPDCPISIPTVCQPVEKHLPDYEVELTIVIGKPAKDVKESEALDYVLGYTVANDVSVLL